jgi:hypothetical protein
MTPPDLSPINNSFPCIILANIQANSQAHAVRLSKASYLPQAVHPEPRLRTGTPEALRLVFAAAFGMPRAARLAGPVERSATDDPLHVPRLPEPS